MINFSSVEEGIEVRIVSRNALEVEYVGNLITSLIKENLSPEEFYDSGTCVSTNRKYNGFIRRIRFKVNKEVKGF